MSSRTRTAEILARAGLIERDLAREKARGAREGQFFSGLASLIPAGVDAAAKIGGEVEQRQYADADRAAALAALEGMGGAGDAELTPGQVASKQLEGVQGPEKTGDPLKDFFADPLGAKARGAEAARAKYGMQLATDVKATRTKSEALAASSAATHAKREAAAAELERKAKADADRLEFDRAKAQQDYELADAKEQARLKAAEDKRNAPPSPMQEKKNEVLDLTLRKLRADVEREADPFAMSKDEMKKRREEMVLVEKLDDSERALRAVIAKYPEIEDYVGPVDNAWLTIKSKLGLSDEKAAEIRSAIGRAFDEYRVAVTGAAAGVQEMETMKQRIPDVGDTLPDIFGKMNAGRTAANAARERLVRMLETGSVRPRPPAPATSTAKADVGGNVDELLQILDELGTR